MLEATRLSEQSTVALKDTQIKALMPQANVIETDHHAGWSEHCVIDIVESSIRLFCRVNGIPEPKEKP